MTLEDILRVFPWAGRASVPAADQMKLALMPLAQIADRYDSNQLTGMAQRVGCCGPSSLDPQNMILVWDRLGRPLLTVADCLTARAAIGGAFSFKDYPVEQSQ